MKKSGRLILVLFLAAAFCAVSLNHARADYPDRPLTLIVVFGPGGATDLASRALGKALEKRLGQPILVVNKPGGGSAVGAAAIASAKPDGYTFGTTLWTTVALLPHTVDVPYSIDSFDYIMINGGYRFGIAVKSDSKFKTLKELTDYAKQNPGKIKYSTTGATVPGNVGMILLGKAAGVQWENVVFKSGAEAATAVLGGHVDATSANPIDVIPFIEAGRMRLLTSLSDKRWKWVPDVPSIRELGYDFHVNAYMGYGAPKGVPKAALEKLREAFKEASRDPEFLANLEKFYTIPESITGDEYRRLLIEESKMNEKFLLEFGLHKSQKK
jgi:tripartite-type tricarboxylate transporter receptor subunit TctC